MATTPGKVGTRLTIWFGQITGRNSADFAGWGAVSAEIGYAWPRSGRVASGWSGWFFNEKGGYFSYTLPFGSDAIDSTNYRKCIRRRFVDFRYAYKKRRRLIPANGFYELKRENQHKQLDYLSLGGADLMGFAGLWEYCEDMDIYFGICRIITTSANEILKPIHNRMPVYHISGELRGVAGVR